MAVTAYVKLTNRCNLNCSHCYLSKEVRADKSVMTKDTMLRTADFLADMTSQKGESLHVVFHGGEPLLLSPAYYYEIGEVIEAACGPHTESIQTSLIPYTHKYSNLIHDRFKSQVGSSVDFSQRTIHGDPEAYRGLWLNKVEMVREDDILVVPGMVPSKSELDKSDFIVDWMLDHDFRIFNVERYNAFGVKPLDWPSNMEHSQFLIKLFDVVIQRYAAKKVTPFVGVLKAAIGGILYQRPGDRWGGSCQSEFVVIEPDGSLNNCPDKSSFERPYGNTNKGVNDFLHSSQRRKTIRLQLIDHKRSHCDECENNSWCKSGCPITPNGPDDGQIECSGYKVFLDYLRRYAGTDVGLKHVIGYYNYDPFLNTVPA